jgi:hypothetical protein
MDSDKIIIEQSSLSSEQQKLVRETLDSIIASSYFKRSKRYPALLEYAVRNTLEGKFDVLKERTVGVEVFGRPANYDPATDSLVRMAASEVRKRMALYFSVHSDAPVRIEMPIGSYAAEFHFPTKIAGENGEEYPNVSNLEPSVADQSGIRKRWHVALAAIAMVVLPLAIWFATHLNRAQPVDKFWGPLLEPHAQVLISVGVPYQPGPPPWLTNLPDNAMVNYIHKQPNNPVPDINAANLVGQFLASRGGKSEIRMASSTEFSDLHRAPAVIIGGGPMSPWTMRLGSNLRFQFQEGEGGAVHWVVDRNNPSDRNWRVDLRLPYDEVDNDFALITRQLNPSTGQWWVGIGGTTNLSTDAAEQMLLDQAAMKILDAQLPKGWERKNLQIVVEFSLVNGTAGGSRVVAADMW